MFLLVYVATFWETLDDHSHLDGFSANCTAWTFSQPLVLQWCLFLFCHWSQDVNWHLCGEKSHLCPDFAACQICFLVSVVTECFPLGFRGIWLAYSYFQLPILHTYYISVSLWAAVEAPYIEGLRRPQGSTQLSPFACLTVVQKSSVPSSVTFLFLSSWHADTRVHEVFVLFSGWSSRSTSG